MARIKNEDKEELHSNKEKAKELLKEVQATNGISVSDIINKIKEDYKNDNLPTINEPNPISTNDNYDEDEPTHIPINTLQEIKKQFGKKVEVIDDETGERSLKPAYTEDEQLKMLFGLLSERGINMLDYLENVLQTTGYSSKVVFSINETMDKTTNLLRDIAEMQFRKQKLINESKNLQIQEYKANLKEKELEIKEKALEHRTQPTGNNIIAVGSPSELLKLINKGSRGTINETDVDVINDFTENEDNNEIEND